VKCFANNVYKNMRSKLALKNKIIRLNKKSLLSIGLTIAVLFVALYPILQPRIAQADVTEAFVRFNRLETGAPVSGTACLKSTATTQTNVVIVFPQGWTISTAPADWTVSFSNLPTDPVGGGPATAWPDVAAANSGTGGGVNGLSVTFGRSGSGNLVSGTFYCFNFAGASSTLGPAGNDKTGQLKTQGGSPYVDSVDWATSVVSSGGDRITVTASVSATMTFSLNANSVTLGTLSTSGATSGTGITQEVSTNARNGWTSWVKSANAGLNSAIASDSIGSAAYTAGVGNIVDLASNPGYVLDVIPGSGSPTAATEYDGNGTTSGGNLDTNFRQTATKTTPGSANQASLVVRARATATTKAASDYTDTLTVVAAGSF
jgi:hypothetical protein